MPKRRSDGRGDRRAAAKRRQRHLYLVLDDWVWGYSIRKVDLSPDSASSSDDDTPHQTAPAVSGAAAIDRTAQRLPPAIVRLEAPRGSGCYFAAAFGTRILAMHPGVVPKRHVPVFDVSTRGLIFGPRSKAASPAAPASPIYIPIGDRLFALSATSFEVLYPPPLEYPGGHIWEWSWCKLPKPAFSCEHATSYAVHPDGRTIFISIESISDAIVTSKPTSKFTTKSRLSYQMEDRKPTSPSVSSTAATFTLDTENTEDFAWRQHGEWILPFTGRAHFDRELDAWVGLSNDPETLGYLCACDVVSAGSGGGNGRCPARKLSKEKLFSEDPADRHVGATLVFMGGRSKFCLVQCIRQDGLVDQRKDLQVEEEDVHRQSCCYLLRLTTFSLKYDRNGDLTTGNSRQVQCYRVPKATTESLLSNPVAFWM